MKDSQYSLVLRKLLATARHKQVVQLLKIANPVKLCYYWLLSLITNYYRTVYTAMSGATSTPMSSG
jgi:hypothetical protein